MNKTLLLSVALSAFGLGCIAASKPFVVPPARAGTNPQKWEYTCVAVDDTSALISKANQLGGQGWELASSSTPNEALSASRWCFKRPL